jgi:hypothetical protein
VRRNPSTVVILAGEVTQATLTAIDRSANVSLIRPATDGLADAADALARAARITAPYVLVAADPLAGLAAEWQAMWDITAERHDLAPFEVQASEVLTAWRAGTFELPDYYLVVTGTHPADPDFYLGPLRSQRPNRVAVAATPGTADPAGQAAEVLRVLGSLRHGPWWPPLDQIVAAARDFYPGSLAGRDTQAVLRR